MASAAGGDEVPDAAQLYSATIGDWDEMKYADGCEDVAGLKHAESVHKTLIQRWWHPNAGSIWESRYLADVRRVVEPLPPDASPDLVGLHAQVFRTPRNVALALNDMKVFNHPALCPAASYIHPRLLDFSNDEHRMTFFGLIHKERLSFLDNPVLTIKKYLRLPPDDLVLGTYPNKFTALHGLTEPWCQAAGEELRRVLAKTRGLERKRLEKLENELKEAHRVIPEAIQAELTEIQQITIPGQEQCVKICEKFIQAVVKRPEEQTARATQRKRKSRKTAEQRIKEEHEQAMLKARVDHLETVLKLTQQINSLQTTNIHSVQNINLQQEIHQ